LFLDKLIEFPRTLYVLIFTIGAFILFILINQLVFAPLSALSASYNVLDFEFAWTVDRITVIFASWGAAVIEAQILGVYWDFFAHSRIWIFYLGLYSFGFSDFKWKITKNRFISYSNAFIRRHF
jgi:hypothetical protein